MTVEPSSGNYEKKGHRCTQMELKKGKMIRVYLCLSVAKSERFSAAMKTRAGGPPARRCGLAAHKNSDIVARMIGIRA